MTTAFQRNAFQNNAFQIDALVVVATLPNNGGAGSAFPRKRKSVRELYKSAKLEREEEKLEQPVEVAADQPDPVVGSSSLPIIMELAGTPVIAGIRAPSLREAMDDFDEEEAIEAILLS